MENIETDSVKERKPWGSRCSKAQLERSKRWRQLHKEQIRQYRSLHHDEIRIRARKKYAEDRARGIPYNSGRPDPARDKVNKALWYEKNKARCKANQRTWQKSNREKVRKKSLARYQANREQINAQKRTRYKINPDIGDRQRAKYVGLTLEQLRALEEKQGHACAICGRRKKKKLNIDHETGVVRGLLCHPCNTAIGLLGDGSELLKRAVAYIEKSELKSSIQ